MSLIPEEGELEVLHEDEHLLVVNKPAGILSHPNPGHFTGSILNRVLYHGYQLKGGEDPLRFGLVHRLDKDTSGILILSKQEESYTIMQNHFRDREVRKEYCFLAFGAVRRMELTCTLALGRHPKKRNTRMVLPEGRDAETYFCLKKMFGPKYSMWTAVPKTGRTHQIRVHAAESGLWILGDPHYSKHNAAKVIKGVPIPRTMLHCNGLETTHPESGEALSISAPLPKDFKDTLSLLESPR